MGPEPVEDIEIASSRTLLRSGQGVRLQAGPPVGTERIFLRVKDEYHLVVSVTLLQRSVSVIVEKEFVAPLFAAESCMERVQN